MNAVVEVVSGLVGGIQRMFGMIILGGLALSAIIAITIWATAPVVAEEAGERIENYAEARVDEAMEEQRAAKCDLYRARAAEAWDKAVSNDGGEGAYTRVDQLDQQVKRFCAP